MKPEDIKIGRKYLIKFGYDLVPGICIGKTEDGAILYNMGLFRQEFKYEYIVYEYMGFFKLLWKRFF